MSRRVFISYEYNEDSHFVNGIRGMLHNPNSEVDFYDESISEAVNSNNSSYVKKVIGDKINRSSVLLCIVGKDTHSSEWVEWEIMKAHELNKKIIFMRRKDNLNSNMPSYLLRLSPYTIMNWDHNYLEKL